MTSKPEDALKYVKAIESYYGKDMASFSIDLVRDDTEEAIEPEFKNPRREFFKNIDLRWKKSDKMLLDQVTKGAALYVDEVMEEVNRVIDTFYSKVREPQVTEHGEVVTNDSGAIQWAKDSQGILIEDWSAITGQDIDAVLFQIAHLRSQIKPIISEKLTEAIFAKHSYDDKKFEHYSKALSGTIDDRKAASNRGALEEKYVSLFRYAIWQRLQSADSGIDDIVRTLEKVRNWRTWDEKNS